MTAMGSASGRPAGARLRRSRLERDQSGVRETAAWFEQLSAHNALFVVNGEQRVTGWSESCGQVLGDDIDPIGRHCWEVMSDMDLRNRPYCRPNCPAVTAARHGQPIPDFDVWIPGSRDDSPAQVSVILREAGSGSLEMLHLVRRPGPRPRQRSAPVTEQQAVESIRPMLSAIAGRDQAPATEAEPSEALTQRQRAILTRLAGGESVEQVARALDLSTITVRNHIQSAMTRLGAHSRLEAVLAALNRGLL